MLWRRTFALLLTLAMLALPASSFAQSAGDDQYQDPLSGQGGGGGNSPSSSSGGGGGNSSPSTTPAASTPSTPGTASTAGTGTGSDPATGASSTANGELPRTGFDVIVTIELGIAMLLSGWVAQRLLVLRDRRQGSHQRP
jgi:hypothetical protein